MSAESRRTPTTKKPKAAPAAVRWAELTPAAFQARRAERALAWIPAGLCAPHGQGVPLGLDLLKAEWLCDQAARAHGGVVAPALGWHLHACGPSARWLEEQVGEVEPHLGEVGPEVFAPFLLHAISACVNAGFRGVVVVSGHHGAHADDLAGFVGRLGAALWVGAAYVSDAQLAGPAFRADHAGRYEVSQLLAIAPGLVTRGETGAGGRLAAGADAGAATAEEGRRILRHLVARLGDVAAGLPKATRRPEQRVMPRERQAVWRLAADGVANWSCLRPHAMQEQVTPGSRWACGEVYPWPSGR
jgi:creatinine amidohydrolase